MQIADGFTRARTELAASVDALPATGADRRLLKRYSTILRSNNALLRRMRAVAATGDFRGSAPFLAAYNEQAAREAQFARRLRIKNCG